MSRARGARVSLLRRIPVSHVRVALFAVNNNPETMDRSRRSFSATAGRFRTDQAGMLPTGFASPKCTVRPRPSYEGASQRERARLLPGIVALRCVSKHEGACTRSSSSFETRARAFEVCRTSSACALLRMRTSIASFTAHDFKQPISFSRRGGVRGLRLLLRSPRMRVGGAPRDVRVLGGTPVGRIMCVKDARERAYDAIRQAPSEAPCVP